MIRPDFRASIAFLECQVHLRLCSVNMATKPDGDDSATNIDAVLAQIKPSNIRDGHDALFFLLHAFFLADGFTPLGSGNDASNTGT